MGYPPGPNNHQGRAGQQPQQHLPPLHSRPNSVASQRYSQQHQGPPYPPHPPHGAPPPANTPQGNHIYGAGGQPNRHYSPQYGNIQVNIHFISII